MEYDPHNTTGKYILDDKGNTVEERDLFKWAEWFEKSERRVAKTIINGTMISTVFIGIDYTFGIGDRRPMLFETMIFDNKRYEGYEERYGTREEALEGHKKAVKMVKSHASFILFLKLLWSAIFIALAILYSFFKK